MRCEANMEDAPRLLHQALCSSPQLGLPLMSASIHLPKCLLALSYLQIILRKSNDNFDLFALHKGHLGREKNQ